MNNSLIRNITIGATDGLTIPFALVAGLSMVVSSASAIGIACMSLGAAGGLAMAAGAYSEAIKYERSAKPLPTAVIIGLSYFLGGTISALPFLFTGSPYHALKISAAITLPALFFAGYFESRVNEAPAWAGGVRVMITGVAAAAGALLVAGIFR